jgi:enamine deaminase RidA (YjgF/YER057c/UK114 family)
VKTFRNPATVHPPLAGYTHQIELAGPERLLVISGQVGRTLDGRMPEDPLEQLELALDNLRLNLEAAGMELRDLLKLTFFLVGESDPARRRDVIAAKLQGFQPCMTLLHVAALASPAIKVEVEALASRA